MIMGNVKDFSHIDFEDLNNSARAYYFAKELEEKAPNVLRHARHEVRRKMQTVDQMIDSIWNVCLSYSDEGWADIEIEGYHDQWWGVHMECPHGKWRAGTDGPGDLSTGFERLLRRVQEEHPKA